MGSQHRKRWNYVGATAVADIKGDLSVIRVTGVVTPSVAGRILADNAQWLAATGAASQIADYRGAALALTADALLSSALDARTVDAALDSPTALLVNAQHQELFSQYASLMARQGICRAPFMDAGQAAQWARMHGAAFQELAAASLRGGSRPSALRTDAVLLAHQAQHRSPGPA